MMLILPPDMEEKANGDAIVGVSLVVSEWLNNKLLRDMIPSYYKIPVNLAPGFDIVDT